MLRRLVEAGWLQRDGGFSRPVYGPGKLRQVVKSYPLHGLQEDIPWQRDFAPNFDLPPHVGRMVQHAFTELLNNAADHSEGSSVTVSLRQTPSHVQLLVSDDGCGVFEKIRGTYDIPDAPLAMLELSKGRLTTAPQAHTGRGLFFSSQLADVFDLHANGTAFQRRAWDSSGWRPGKALPRQGTSIYMAIALDTTRTLEQVLGAWSVDGSGIAFDRTVISLRLLAGPGQAFGQPRPGSPRGRATGALQARRDRLRRRARHRPRLRRRVVPSLPGAKRQHRGTGAHQRQGAHLGADRERSLRLRLKPPEPQRPGPPAGRASAASPGRRR